MKRIILIIICLFFWATKPTLAATYFVSPSGSSSGDGSSNNPYDLGTGNSKMVPGDTLILKDGIYSIDTVNNGWLNLGPSSTTTRSYVYADTGARPIITDVAGHPPNVLVGGFVHVAGLWFGSPVKDTYDHVFQHGNDVELVGLTLFNYFGGVNEGTHMRNKYINNRFIFDGSAPYYHPIYINNCAVSQATDGTLIDGNIFVDNSGYSIHLWHGPNYTTIRNNFIADSWASLVLNGLNHQAYKNIFWSTNISNHSGTLNFSTGTDCPPYTSSYIFNNNLVGPVNFLNSTLPSLPGVSASGNVFVGGVNPVFGTNFSTWTLNDFKNNIGTSSSQIDSAVSNLETSFLGKTLQQIHDDPTIEGNFNVIKNVQNAWTNDIHPSPTPIPTPAQVDLNRGLAGYWKMDESSWINDCQTPTVIDFSNNGYNGMSCPAGTGPVGGVVGVSGNSGYFNGTGQNINIPVQMINATNPTFSYSLWVKADDTGGNWQDILAQARGGTNNNASYELIYDPTSNGYEISLSGGDGSRVNSYSYDLKNWTHLVVVNDYTNNIYNLYINGALAKTGTAVGLPSQTLGAQFKIGTHPYLAYNRHYNGFVDEVRIYNRALNPAEVAALYSLVANPGSPSPSPLGGDFNGDGKVDINDLRIVLNYFGSNYSIFDLSQVIANFGK